VACRTSDALESIHPSGKLLEGPSLRTQLVEVIDSSRQLYDEACNLLRDRAHTLILREDLESKLSASLANMEMELKKCSVQKCIDGKIRAYFNVSAPNEDVSSELDFQFIERISKKLHFELILHRVMADVNQNHSGYDCDQAQQLVSKC